MTKLLLIVVACAIALVFFTRPHAAKSFIITVTASPTPTATATAAAGVHYLDDTGCQDFAANSKFNLSEASAAIDSNSGSMISQANGSTYGVGGAALGVQIAKEYAIVPSSQPLVSVGAGGRSTHPSSFPIPSYGSTMSGATSDHAMSLLETSGAPDCSMWEGYGFSLSGSTWTGYSGNGPIPTTGAFLNYPQLDGASGPQPCDGVSDNCAMDMGVDLTYYEANNASPTNPILHTFHGEAPSGMTCDDAPSGSTTYCVHVTGGSTGNFGLIRLHSSVTCPSNAAANQICITLKTYGMTVDDNGCCWNILTEREDKTDDGTGTTASFPSAATSFLTGLHVTDFDVIDPVWSGVY